MVDVVNWRVVVLGLLCAFGLGFASAGLFFPRKVETKTEIQYVEKLRVQEVKQADVVTVVVEKRRPDGTITLRTRTVDKSKSETALEREAHATETKWEYYEDQYQVKALIRLGANRAYGLAIEARTLGPFWLGAWALTDRTVGLSLGISF